MISSLYIQLIGHIGLFFIILMFFYNKRNTMLLLGIISNVFYTIHWILLSAFTASIVTSVAILRNIIFKNRTTKKWADHKGWLLLFLSLTILFGLLVWSGPASILPLLASVLMTLGPWSKNPLMIRRYNTLAMIPWFAYAILIGSQAVIISSTLLFISGLYNILRFDLKKEVQVKNKEKLNEKK